MEIDGSVFSNSEIITEGTTCFILRTDDNKYYKIYKSSLRYINGIDDYDDRDIKTRLEYLVSKKDTINDTLMPQNILLFNNKAVGIELQYMNDGISLKEFLLNNENDLISVKEKVLAVVRELIDNGIVPTDPHYENFLVSFDADGNMMIKMIDVDDQYVSVYPNEEKSVWYETEVSTCYRVIDLSFEKIQEEMNRKKK